MPALYGIREIEKIALENSLKQTEFLSGKRKTGLNRLFSIRGSRKGVYIPMGLNVLKLYVKKKMTNGNLMFVLSFKKQGERDTIGGKLMPFGWDSYYNNKTYPFLPIMCYHIATEGISVNFAKRFYSRFTTDLAEKDLRKLKTGLQFKALIKYVEEPWTLRDGTVKKYTSGANVGKEIILTRPEIEKLYHIDTPDEDICVNYFKLYKTYKK